MQLLLMGPYPRFNETQAGFNSHHRSSTYQGQRLYFTVHYLGEVPVTFDLRAQSSVPELVTGRIARFRELSLMTAVSPSEALHFY